jgi:hypothetical protein
MPLVTTIGMLVLLAQAPAVQPPAPPPQLPAIRNPVDEVKAEKARYATVVRQFGQERQQAQAAYRSQTTQCPSWRWPSSRR